MRSKGVSESQRSNNSNKKPREQPEESRDKTEVSQICEVLQDDLEEKRFKTTLKYIFQTK